MFLPLCTLYAQSTDSIVSKDSLRKVQFSNQSLESEVVYHAKDSSMLDVEDKKLYLWGEAELTYLLYKVNAPIIVVDFSKKEISAYTANWALRNNKPLRVLFRDGEDLVELDSMKFNFESKKALIFSAASKQNDLFIHGERTKIISEKRDSGQVQNIVYNQNAIITTCNKEIPHYGIRSLKQKLVTDKLAVVGLSYLEIEKVPTPLVLPFGFFPLHKKKHHGLIIPRDYENSASLGFGFKGVGYYFPISEHWQTIFKTDIYLRGTFTLYNETEYSYKYRYHGNFNFNYSSIIIETAESIKKDIDHSFAISWNHIQDPKANPKHQFSADVKFSGNDNQGKINNNVGSVLNNRFGSNISYRRVLPAPFSLSFSAEHSQTRSNRDVEIRLPSLDFIIQRIQPFKQKPSQTKQWYHDIGLTYNASFNGELKGKDTTLFSPSTLKKVNAGFSHRTSANLNMPLLKFINIGLNMGASQGIGFNRVNYVLDTTLTIRVKDTIFNTAKTEIIGFKYDTLFGKLDTSNRFAPISYYDGSASLSLSTNLYGTVQFKGKLKAIRHTLRPSFSMSFVPKIANNSAFDSIYLDSRPTTKRSQISHVYEPINSNPISRANSQVSFNYSFTNLFEVKYTGKKDTADKKIKILDNIIVSGNYSPSLSNTWSKVSLRTNSNIFKKYTSVGIFASMDPYGFDSIGKRSTVTLRKSGKGLLRFENLSVDLNTRLSVRQLLDFFKPKSSDQNKKIGVGLLDNFSLQHNFNLYYDRQFTGDTLYINYNSINTAGTIALSKRWTMVVSSIGYDFISKSLTYPDLGFNCDLHCWEMGMNWQPQRGSYSFYLRVKPSTFGFINVPYRKNQFDTFTGF